MTNPTRPEPMNATTHHPKVNVTLTLAEPYFIAGEYISGKMEMDCKADRGLGIGVMMIELFAIQELTSRDHSARSTFIHARRLFQGPGLPPSNAVQAHPMPGDPPLPLHYHQARRGHSTFLFRLPLPATSPSSISFGSGLASVKYEVRASVGVSWKGERQLVTDKKDAEVVEAYDEDRIGTDEPEVTVVGENGKIWCQARLIGSVLVAGESACIELQVKNHSAKKNTGLSIALNRSLFLANVSSDEEPLQINDTVTTVPFRGPEYIIPPGVEGVASLVFDVPKRTKGVRGGLLIGDESEALGNKSGPRLTQGLFEVNCVVAVKMTMGLGNKDILVELPVPVVHPSVLPKLSPPEQYPGYPYYDYGQAYAPYLQSSSTPFLPPQSPYTAPAQSPYAPHPALPMSPGPAYVDSNQNLVWFPPLSSSSSEPYHHPDPYYYHPLQYPVFEQNLASAPIPRPSSASALPGLPSSRTHDLTSMFGSAGPIPSQQTLPPLPRSAIHRAPSTVLKARSVRYGGVEADINGEEGTGQRASRIAQTLRISSQAQRRGRSVSPAGGHRYPLSTTNATISGPPASSVPRPTLAPLPPIDTTSFSSAPLHSPRPVLSPKRSYTNITTVSADGGEMVNKSVTKSERVEELERMADELGSKTKDLSGDLPDEPPPVPTMTDKVKLVAKAKTRAAVEDYFSSVPPMNQPIPAVADVSRNRNLASSIPIPPAHRSRTRSRTPPTPATPTLTAVATPSKSKLNGQTTKGLLSLGVPGGGGGGGRTESGLDALERKLLAEVGTRKVVDDKRPDVWTILGGDKKATRSPTDKPSPISIPRRDSDRDPLNDSAISSLTLPDCGDINSPINQNLNTHTNLHGTNAMDLEKDRDRDSDEKTHRGGLSGKKKNKNKKTASKGTLKDGMDVDDEEHEKDKERKSGRKKGKERSSAKGRVAAWLGGVEAEPPLDDVIASSPSPSPANVELSSENHDTAQSSSSPKPADDESSVRDLLVKDNEVGSSSPVPNPRSSGFVPIGNLKRDIYQRTLVPKDLPVASTNPTDDARRITDMWNRHGNAIKNVTEGARQNVAGKGKYSLLPPMKSDPEVKYDIRSARGGKGGRVTAVAAIWASGAAEPMSNKPTTSPLPSARRVAPKEKVIPAAKLRVSSPFSVPKLPVSTSSSSSSTSNDGINVRRVTSTKLGVQVSSVPIPAVISSSHAKPTLSTTASLARPSAAGATKGSPVKVPPTISELPSEAKVGSGRSSGATGKPTAMDVGGGKGNNSSSVADASSSSRSPPSTVGEHLAFGQARLRDLIKKYQGQTAS